MTNNNKDQLTIMADAISRQQQRLEALEQNITLPLLFDGLVKRLNALEERLYRLEDRSIPELCMRVKDLETKLNTTAIQDVCFTPEEIAVEIVNKAYEHRDFQKELTERAIDMMDQYNNANQPTPQTPDLSEAIKLMQETLCLALQPHSGPQCMKNIHEAIAILERSQKAKKDESKE